MFSKRGFSASGFTDNTQRRTLLHGKRYVIHRMKHTFGSMKIFLRLLISRNAIFTHSFFHTKAAQKCPGSASTRSGSSLQLSQCLSGDHRMCNIQADPWGLPLAGNWRQTRYTLLKTRIELKSPVYRVPGSIKNVFQIAHSTIWPP